MPRTSDTIPAQPFVTWLRREHERLQADKTLQGPGLSEHPATTLLGERLGVHARSIRRYLHSLNGESRPVEAYDRAVIENMLDRAGIPIWELYPDIELTEDGAQAYCPSCRDDVMTPDGLCPWCSSSTLPGRPKGSTARRGQGRKMTDDQVRAAHKLYVELGVGTVELGRLLWERYDYASPWRCAQALQRNFRLLDLPLRPRARQSPAFLATRSQRCDAITRRGTRCKGLPRDGGTLCPAHSPGIEERARAALAHAYEARRASFVHPLTDELTDQARHMHVEGSLTIHVIAHRLAPKTGRAPATIYSYLRVRAQTEGWYLGPRPDRTHAQGAAA